MSDSFWANVAWIENFAAPDDSLARAELTLVSEDWIVANARPAPGFVMIYSNTCYAPGASEGGHAPATPFVAAQRVAHYSRKVFAMGGSAYYATDFDRGAADLVGRLLADRRASFGTAFVSDHRYVPSALTSQAHPFAAGQTIWLHRSKYTDGPPNYWYAFAGNPDLSPIRAWDRTAPTALLASPGDGATDVAPDAVLRVKLSEPVEGVGDASISLRDASGDVVPATVTYDAPERAATIEPAKPLALSATYSIAVGHGIHDAAGRPLAPGSWRFATRLDADPLGAPLPIVLESGTHELMRFDPDGSVAERRALDVAERRWLLADRRARIPAHTGSWLRIADAALGTWWVAESSEAHAFGQVEEAKLVAGTEVTLPPMEHALHGFGADGPSAGDGLAVAGARTITVDRRRVFDGRIFLHLADSEFAGAWIEAHPAVAPTEAAAQRILDVERRPAEAGIIVAGGGRPAFRFDGAGRVIERRELTDAESAQALSTLETRVVGGARFAIVSSGELAGWALAEDAHLQFVPLTGGAQPAG